MTATTTAAPRDWWVIAGMTTAATSAALASFTGLRGLAEAAGWPARLAWLLPVTIDAYAMTSARVWLTGHTGQPSARRFARANALGAIAASITGNAAYHAIGAHLLAGTWPVVVLVGAVPATVLGLTAHLHALRARIIPAPLRTGTRDGTADQGESGPHTRTEDGRGDRPGSGTGDRPEPGPPEARMPARPRPRSPSRRRHRTADELLAAARDADARYRQTHDRPITRDALRAALRISGPRATELRRRLAPPRDPDPAPQPVDPAAAVPGDAQPPADRPPPEPPAPESPPATHPDHRTANPTAPDRKEASTQP